MKYPNEARLCCPRCSGLGYIEVTQKDIFYKHNNTENKTKCRKWRNEIRKIGRYKIGKIVGITRPQQVKHHLVQIETYGWENFE